MKKILLLSLLAIAVLFIAACAPKEGGEEGAIAGQAYGGAGGGSGSSVEVKACADTGTSVTYTKLKGGDVTKADECAAGNKRKDYSCSTISGGTGKRKQSKTYLNTYTMPCGAGTTCSNGVCVAVAAAACGNNMKEGTEVCDGTDLGGAGCNTQTKDPSATGTLKCYSDCTGFDTSLCVAKIQTGNGTMEIVQINKTTGVTYKCIGTIPPNAHLCPGDDQGLTTDGYLARADWCADAANDFQKCQYICDEGYVGNGQQCVIYTPPPPNLNQTGNTTNATNSSN